MPGRGRVVDFDATTLIRSKTRCGPPPRQPCSVCDKELTYPYMEWRIRDEEVRPGEKDRKDRPIYAHKACWDGMNPVARRGIIGLSPNIPQKVERA